jgi:hypothetical protein
MLSRQLRGVLPTITMWRESAMLQLSKAMPPFRAILQLASAILASSLAAEPAFSPLPEPIGSYGEPRVSHQLPSSGKVPLAK